MKRKKLKLTILFIVVIITASIATPSTRSYIVMSIYSAVENSKSVMHENDFKIKVPSSKGWYPFVITFNPVNFGKWSGTGADMSIMYNFAEFNFLHSDVFNQDSPKHSSFYGAYALSQEDGYFGYDDEDINLDEIVLTFKYDYRLLVLRDLGCAMPIFKVINAEITEDVSCLDMNGWTQIDAQMQTNAMLHNYNENHTSYVQYGKPKETFGEDFPVITMYGRLYIRAFEEYNSTVIVYVMSPSEDTINQCDDEILQNIIIKPID